MAHRRALSPRTRRRPPRRGFTLIELVTVIVVLAVLSAVAMPVYLDYTADAKKSACKGALGALRTAIGNYYSWKATDAGGGTASYPTVAALSATGTVLADAVPENPFDTDSTKNNIVDGTGQTKGTIVGSSGGWCYNPANGQVWANTGTKLTGENAF